jgi:diguanylate cyclase (GGDEF)-like protein/PAS domain S-box-containing protein
VPDVDPKAQSYTAALGALARHDCFAAGDLPACLATITELGGHALGVARASVWFFSDDGDTLDCADLFVVTTKRHKTGLTLRKADFPRYFAALQDARAIAADDAWTDPRTSEFRDGYFAELGIGAMLDVPILFGGRMVGVLCNEHTGAPRTWSREDQVFAASLGDFVALALTGDERRRTEAALRISEERLELAVTATRSAVWDADPVSGTNWWSPQFSRLLGHTDIELSASADTFMSLVHPDDLPGTLAILSDSLTGSATQFRALYRMRHRTGDWIWVEDVGTILRDATGRAIRMTGIKCDVTDRVLADHALRRAEERYRGIFENSITGLFQITGAGRFIDVNPALARMLGYETPADMLAEAGDNALALLIADPGRRDELLGLLAVQDRVIDFEAGLYRRDGPIVWVSHNIRIVRTVEGAPDHLEGSIEDITHRKRAEAHISHMALHDGLTNLPNRLLFMDRLAQSLGRVRLTGRGGTGILSIDFDNFKLINDSRGHAVGDGMLIELGARMLAHMRPGDTLARLGSDEFAVLVDNVTRTDEALALAEHLRTVLARPLRLQGEHDVFPSASIGIAVDTGERDCAEDLVRDAGIALTRSKTQGRGRCLVFSPTMTASPLLMLRLQTDLRRALQQDEFLLHYQPVVALYDRKLLGFEALIRWHHPERGLISPAAFIPAAEESGLMAELGQWVLRAACRQMRAWQDRVAPHTPLSLSINVSPGQLVQPDAFTLIDEALNESDVDVRRLKLEVTETALADDGELLSQRLRGLRERGFQILIDDFGTGYSSLSRLHRLPIDGLKIDQSFIKPMLFDRDSAAIVRTVIALGHALDIEVVAEGVEDEPTAAELLRQNCPYAQGYHFARPLPVEAADELVRQIAGVV